MALRRFNAYQCHIAPVRDLGHDKLARQGDLLVVPASPHSLHVLEDSAVLLTVAKLP